MSELAITLPREIMARVEKWATEHGLSASEALVQLIERGLLAPPESPRRNRGHPVQWGDGAYLFLHGLVSQTKGELEHKNGPGLPRVTNKQAIEALRKRFPGKWWSKYSVNTLLSRFYDAQRRLLEIRAFYDHDAATTGNQG
jgi:hypothetical protein